MLRPSGAIAAATAPRRSANRTAARRLSHASRHKRTTSAAARALACALAIAATVLLPTPDPAHAGAAPAADDADNYTDPIGEGDGAVDELPEFVSETFAEPIATADEHDGGRLGAALALFQNITVIGQPTIHNDNIGQASLYEFDLISYSLLDVISPDDGEADDWFGRAVAIYGPVILVGAPRKGDSTGAVYAFVLRDHDNTTSTPHKWDSVAKLPLGPLAVTGDECGHAIQMHDTVALVACPFADVEFENEGVVHAFVPAEISESVPLGTYDFAMTLRPNAPSPANQFGQSIHLSAADHLASSMLDLGSGELVVAVGTPYGYGGTATSGSAFVFTSHVDSAGTWVQTAALWPPVPQFRGEFGWSVAIDNSWEPRLVVGSPRFNTLGMSQAGASYVFHLDVSTGEWVYNAALVPDDIVAGDLSGYQVGITANTTLICSPRADPFGLDEAGACYFFIHNRTMHRQVTKVTASTPFAEAQFGEVAMLNPRGSVMGAPRQNAFRGAAYDFAGYEVFPIAPPLMIPDSGSYLIGSDFRVRVLTANPTEKVFYRTDGQNPSIFDTEVVGSQLFLPYRTQTWHLKSITSNFRLGRLFLSVVIPDTYHLWVAEPGLFWTGIELQNCSAPWMFCPGTFADHLRYNVTYGHYSAPVAAPLSQRSYEMPCEPEFYCVQGERYTCDAGEFCWPEPAQIIAAQSPDLSKRQPGLGVGDVLIVVFNNRTNMIPLASTDRVLDLLVFSETMGDGLSGSWANETTLEVTITDDSALGDPWLTRVNTMTATVHPDGDLRLEHNYTQPSDTTTTNRPAMLAEGTWGDWHQPFLIGATANYTNDGQQEYGAGPGYGDTLTVKWDSLVDWSVPITTQAEVDALLVFTPPITDAAYTGVWWSWSELLISFGPIDGDNPNLAVSNSRVRDYYGVGTLQVSMRLPSAMRSRDQSSPFVELPTPVVVDGTWGDVPAEPYLTYDSATTLSVFFATPDSAHGYNISHYRVEVSLSEDFDPVQEVVNEVIVADPQTEASGGSYTNTYTVEQGAVYYARVTAMNLGGRWGPTVRTRPPKIVIGQPRILRRISVQNIITEGEVVTLKVQDLGRGLLAAAMPIHAILDNGATKPMGFHRVYRTDDCWLEPTDGSILYCRVPPGVGTHYRWNITARGVTSNVTDASTETWYRRPVVHEFDLFAPGVIQAQSNGSQWIRFWGANFGTVEDNAIIKVVYRPTQFNHVPFTAQDCEVTVDHHVIECFSAPGAGTDLRWAVTIEDQTSGVVATGYEGPTIREVRKLEPGDRPHELSSSGGETVRLLGLNFGPNRADIPILVKYWSVAPVAGGVHPRVVEDWFDAADNATLQASVPSVFVADDCYVHTLHTEIRCRSVPGYALEPFEWSVTILGQVSPVHQGVLYVGSPRMFELNASASTPTQGNTRIVRGENFAAAFPERMLLEYRGELIDTLLVVSPEELNFFVPAGTGTGNTISVTVNGAKSNTVELDYEIPVIESLELKWMESDQLEGVFASEFDVGPDGEARFGHLPDAGPGSSVVSVGVSPGVSENRVGDNEARDAWPWFHLAHRCLEIKVHGRNFGVWVDRVTMLIDGTDLCEFGVHGPPVLGHFVAMCCTQRRRGNFTVGVSGQRSAITDYDVDTLVPALQIDSVAPNVTASFGELITFRGSGFLTGGEWRGHVVVRRPDADHFLDNRITIDSGDIIHCDVTYYTDTEVRCVLRPTDHRFEQFVTVSVQTYSYASQRNLSSNVHTITYEVPTIETVEPAVIPARGAIIEVTGRSFGYWGSRMGRVRLFPQAVSDSGSVIDPGATSDPAEGSWVLCHPIVSWNHTHVMCAAPAGTGNASVSVYVRWSTSDTTAAPQLNQPASPERLVFSGARRASSVSVAAMIACAVVAAALTLSLSSGGLELGL